MCVYMYMHVSLSVCELKNQESLAKLRDLDWISAYKVVLSQHEHSHT